MKPSPDLDSDHLLASNFLAYIKTLSNRKFTFIL